MTTMRERIAIVYWNHFGGPEPWGSKLQSESSRRDWLEGADAVLAAIEDADDVMMFAGAKALEMEMQAPSATLMGIGWRAMVRAARGDK